MHPEAIEQPRVHIRNVAVPETIRVRRQREALEFLLAVRIEETHFDAGGLGGKAREIRALAVPEGAVFRGGALLDAARPDDGHR